METKKKSGAVKRINAVISAVNWIGSIKKRVNNRMEGKYSPALIAMIMAAAAAVLTIFMLFIPNCLGVADDGSIQKVMNSAGVSYIKDDISDNYNNYFVKLYSNVQSGYQQKRDWETSHVAAVKAAVWLDNVITRDKFFDIRFLALIYSIFYIPAFYLLVKQGCMRVKTFSEGIAIGVVGLFIFSDVAYVTYFNSFYPEAVWFISLLYLIGAAVSFQENRSGWGDAGSLFLFVLSGTVFAASRQETAFLGIILAVFCIRLIFTRRNWKWGMLCIIAAFWMSVVSIFGMVNLESDFNETSKFHAMTRGVLFGSDNPAKTLEEFGIPSSYELLADASSYAELPLVQAENPVISQDFLKRYTVMDIGFYYLKHPGKFLGMTDVAIKSCFGIRRDFCGNYEKNAGLPKRAKSIFWSVWSTFKNNSAPKTIGFLIVLIGAALLLFGKGYSLRPESDERHSTVLLDSMLILAAICFFQAGITIINSGDAEMIRHCFPISLGMDLMTYFVLAALVHKMNIF